MSVMYEQWLVLGYIKNSLHYFSHSPETRWSIIDGILDNSAQLGIKPSIKPTAENLFTSFSETPETKVTKNIARSTLKAIDARMKKSKAVPGQKFRTLQLLADFYSLNKTERGIFTVAFLYQNMSSFSSIGDKLEQCGHSSEVVLAAFLSVKPDKILACLSGDSRLMKEKLLNNAQKHLIMNSSIGVELSSTMVNLLDNYIPDLKALNKLLVGKPLKPGLAWKDFYYLKKNRNYIFDLLKGSLKQKATGVNVLIYGAPGTGKTELCKVIAKRLGLRLYSAGENINGNEPDRSERLSLIRMTQRLLSRQKKVIVLFDEMEDIFSSPSAGLFALLGEDHSGQTDGSKVYLNQLLETNPVPTFWTSNSVKGVDPSFLRRMTYILKLEAPPLENRIRIWYKHLQKNKIKLNPELVNVLAENPGITPGITSSVARSIRLAERSSSEVEHIIRGYVSAMGIKFNSGKKNESDFNLQLVSVNLSERMLHQVVLSDVQNQSFFLYGPPGTGKSAFARYVAYLMRIPVIEKRPSDLLSRYVGETEKSIRQAFEEAHKNKAMLIIDEADSILANRSGLSQQWERNMVSEILICIDSYDIPFCCTTNLIDFVDDASLRRFDHKIEFTYLTPGQVNLAFEHYFNLKPPQELLQLKSLTPGDFSVVKRRCEILGVDNTKEIAELLKQECQYKKNQSKPIGFMA